MKLLLLCRLPSRGKAGESGERIELRVTNIGSRGEALKGFVWRGDERKVRILEDSRVYDFESDLPLTSSVS